MYVKVYKGLVCETSADNFWIITNWDVWKLMPQFIVHRANFISLQQTPIYRAAVFFPQMMSHFQINRFKIKEFYGLSVVIKSNNLMLDLKWSVMGIGQDTIQAITCANQADITRPFKTPELK